MRTLFGAGAASIVAKSTSLTADLKALQAAGRRMQLGNAGQGSSTDKVAKTITIDRNFVGDAASAVQTIAHEAGHARYTVMVNGSSREAYIRSNLRDEGAATLSNILAEREIIVQGGPDIGIAGNQANVPAYNKAYDTYLADHDVAKARDSIGAIYGNGEHTSGTGQTYRDYYGAAYDRAHPPKHH